VSGGPPADDPSTGRSGRRREAATEPRLRPRTVLRSADWPIRWASSWATRGHDWRLIPVVPALFAFAWGASNSPPEEAAARALVSLTCVALATIVVAAVPGAVAKAGIVAWAVTDLALAVANHLERASRAITNAAPAPPAVGPLASLQLQRLQLQRVVLGPVSIEYADLFVAAVLGAVLAADSRNRGLASLLGAREATSLGAFFLVTNVLPATVPAAVALGLEELRSHSRIGQMSPLRLHGRLLGG